VVKIATFARRQKVSRNTIKNKQMESVKRNFIKNPTIKNLILFILPWFVGILLLTLSATDLFTESFFQKKYVAIYFLMISSTIATGKLYFYYWKNKSLNSHSNPE
jgi:hypothetical protein